MHWAVLTGKGSLVLSFVHREGKELLGKLWEKLSSCRARDVATRHCLITPPAKGSPTSPASWKATGNAGDTLVDNEKIT